MSQRILRNDLFAIGVLTLVVYCLLALINFDPADPTIQLVSPLDQAYQRDILVFPPHPVPTNPCGWMGATIADLLFTALGLAAFYVLVGLAALSISMLVRGKLNSLWIRSLGWVMSLVGLTAILHIAATQSPLTPIISAGGYLGALANGLLQMQFGSAGKIILISALTLVGVMFWTDYLVFRLLKRLFTPMKAAAGAVQKTAAAGAKSLRARSKARATASGDNDLPPVRNRAARDDLATESTTQVRILPAKAAAPPPPPPVDEVDDVDQEWDDESEEFEVADDLEEVEERVVAGGRAVATGDERQRVMQDLDKAALEEKIVEFELPSLDLLEPAANVPHDELRQEALRRARILETTFKQFGFNVKVVDIETGPVIAQYELELEAGLRLAKISNLADDLAIALRVPSVRIVAPIPGKNTVGIEVPNDLRQTVRLREVMERGAAKAAKMKIPLFLGEDVRGEPLVVDLATLPHLLIAGRTGTGKSVCLNAIIASMLMTRLPDEVRMLMIDPKMVELSGYGSLPHLMHPVVTDMRKAEAILAWAVDKMEERYSLLARAGVRHITSYNQLGAKELLERLQPESDDEAESIPRTLPFIVIVADEMADLMMTAGKEVQQHIIRLAQKSRAVGIHLILATQKPTVDVITGLIKSNLPARIAFQVATRTDSQVVLDSNGAERLLGNGDMLFLWPGTSNLVRGQGTYLNDQEIDSITQAVSTGEQHFVHELVNIQVNTSGDASAGGDLKNRDELYDQAIEIVIREGRGSVSLLQRALGIGYGRAARLIDFMEQDGIVGVYAGQKSREVLLTMSQWQQKKAGQELEASSGSSTPPVPAPKAAITKGARIRAEAPSPVGVSSRLESYEYDEIDEEDEEEEEFERPVRTEILRYRENTVDAGADVLEDEDCQDEDDLEDYEYDDEEYEEDEDENV